jgi:hypothetical protein
LGWDFGSGKGDAEGREEEKEDGDHAKVHFIIDAGEARSGCLLRWYAGMGCEMFNGLLG